MDKQLLLLAAKLLDLSSDEFSNHGCNDLDKEIISSLKGEDELCEDISKWMGDPDLNISHIPDWMLMRYISNKFKEEVE